MNWSYLYLAFHGRIGRQTFWTAFVLIVGLELACHLAVSQLADGERVSAIVSLAFVYPEFAVFLKRGYDRNLPLAVIAAFFLMSTLTDFVVIIGLGGSRGEPSALLTSLFLPWFAFALTLLVELGLRRGTVGPNQHGPDPLVSS